MKMKLKRNIVGEMMTTFLFLFSFEVEPDHHAGDNDHLHQLGGGPPHHLGHQDGDYWFPFAHDGVPLGGGASSISPRKH